MSRLKNIFPGDPHTFFWEQHPNRFVLAKGSMVSEKSVKADKTGHELHLCHVQAWMTLGKLCDFFELQLPIKLSK